VRRPGGALTRCDLSQLGDVEILVDETRRRAAVGQSAGLAGALHGVDAMLRRSHLRPALPAVAVDRGSSPTVRKGSDGRDKALPNGRATAP
jgi:hypothetical protein